MYFDAHTHLHDKAFDADRPDVIARMRETNTRAVTVGTDFETSTQAVSLAAQLEGVWAAIGLHPNDNKEESFDAQKFATLVEHPKVVAIGECGLDYFRGREEDKHRQKLQFEAQISFAVTHDKPLMIHCRDAHEDTIALLSEAKKTYGETVRGVIHFFTGTADIAKRYLDLDFYLSFPGVVTFTDMYDEVVQNTPLERILSETDAPYAAPMPFRGKRNEPSYVRYTAQKLASLTGVEPDTMTAQIEQNASEIFGIPRVA